MTHRFTTGQMVELVPKILRPAAPGPYEIRHLVPDAGREKDPSYRIKSVDEKYDRVAPESELVLPRINSVKDRAQKGVLNANPSIWTEAQAPFYRSN